MSDLLDHDTRDDDIRNLLARARDDAPEPTPWHEVIERSDHRRHRPGWAVLAAAAAVVAVGTVGLVLTLQSRNGTDDVPADDPSVDTVTPADPAAAPVDPLADLGEDDWVVPVGDLPDGYQLLVATQSDSFTLGAVVGGDTVPEVYLSVTGMVEQPDDMELGEVALIDGVPWNIQTVTSEDGTTVGHFLSRRINRQFVQLSTRADRDTATSLAAALVPAAESELTVPILSRDGEYVPVATHGETTMSVHGVSGFYCWQLDVGGPGAASQGCSGHTEPGTPIALLGGFGSPDGSFAVGLAESDVVRIEFVRPNGEVSSVETNDESGRFDQHFWISDDQALSSSEAFDRAAVVYDDGSSVIVERSEFGNDWEIVEGAVSEALIDPLRGLGDGD